MKRKPKLVMEVCDPVETITGEHLTAFVSVSHELFSQFPPPPCHSYRYKKPSDKSTIVHCTMQRFHKGQHKNGKTRWGRE